MFVTTAHESHVCSQETRLCSKRMFETNKPMEKNYSVRNLNIVINIEVSNRLDVSIMLHKCIYIYPFGASDLMASSYVNYQAIKHTTSNKHV